MPFYKVNMMGGFRVADRDQVLDEGRVYEFDEAEVSESRGLAAALRSRWLIETDKDGRPTERAKPRKPAPQRSRPPAEEADMFPDGEMADEEAELDRVNEEETALHFDGPSDLDTVATPSGEVGPKPATKAKPKAIKPKAKPKRTRKKPRRRTGK